MIFPYQVLISEAPDGGDYVLILRPEVPVIILGPSGRDTYLGLVDAGSDHTIFPKSIADELGIRLRPATGPPAKVFGGHPVSLLIGDSSPRADRGGAIVSMDGDRPILRFCDDRGGDDHSGSHWISRILHRDVRRQIRGADAGTERRTARN